MRRSPTQPPACVVTGWRKTDAVIASVGGGKSEFASGGAAGVDDSVIVVEGLVDCHGDGKGRIVFIQGGLSGVLKSRIMAYMSGGDVSNCNSAWLRTVTR